MTVPLPAFSGYRRWLAVSADESTIAPEQFPLERTKDTGIASMVTGQDISLIGYFPHSPASFRVADRHGPRRLQSANLLPCDWGTSRLKVYHRPMARQEFKPSSGEMRC